jgi:GAF domain-containing protein
VRNEAIGAMEFELDRDEPLPDGAMELVTAVSQRLGLAMENRRLFDETQRVAQRETLINDIAADLQSATGIDTIIQRAARHLQQTLSAQQVTIHLDTLPNEQGQTKERS